MKKIPPFLLLLLFHSGGFCQDLTGIWEGEFRTDLAPNNIRTFFMHMEILQTGRDVRAVFFNSQPYDIAHPGVMYRISGRFSTKKGLLMFPLTLYRDRIIQNSISRGVAEVFIGFNAWYMEKDSMQLLYGIWIPGQYSPRSDGAGGAFWLRRATDTISAFTAGQLQQPVKKIKKVNKALLPADTAALYKKDVANVKTYASRQQSIADTIAVPSENVRIELFDNAEIDGDSVSIYLDDKPVLLQQLLSTQPIVKDLVLTKGKTHKISVFADNMGAIPPNTALMVIIAGSFRKYLFLSADYNTNAGVLLKLMD
jgi:hypothetical protein